MLTLVGMATRSAMLTVGGATGLIIGDEMAAFTGCCCIVAAFHMICCPAGSTGLPDTSAYNSARKNRLHADNFMTLVSVLV